MPEPTAWLQSFTVLTLRFMLRKEIRIGKWTAIIQVIIIYTNIFHIFIPITKNKKENIYLFYFCIVPSIAIIRIRTQYSIFVLNILQDSNCWSMSINKIFCREISLFKYETFSSKKEFTVFRMLSYLILVISENLRAVRNRIH